VWFRYTATFTGPLRVSTAGSNFDTVLSAYTGPAIPGEELACNDDWDATTQSQITFTVAAGQSYLIEASAFIDSGGGTLVLTAGQPVTTPDCGAAATAAMIGPAPGSVLEDAAVTFTWSAGCGASAYWLDVGTTPGQGTVFAQNLGLVTGQTVSGLPVNGSTIYARLWTQLNGVWQYNDYTYLAAVSCGAPGKASMSAPAPGTTLAGTTASFTWNGGCSAAGYWLDVGTGQGKTDVFSGNAGLTTHQTVAGIPVNGVNVFARLWTLYGGDWQYNDYTYTAPSCGGAVKASMSSPAPGATLSGPAVTFTWAASCGASAYWLDVGTTQGQGNIFGQNVGLATSQAVSGIPMNGARIYVRLWTQLNGAWQANDYSYTAAGSTPGGPVAGLAQMSSPAAGSTLSGANVTFSWSSAAGADNYWLDVGTSAGHGEISAGTTTATSKTVNGLPCDGRTLYVRLWTHLAAGWQTPFDYTYKAASNCAVDPRAVLTAPAPGATLTDTTAAFTWTAGTGADQYWLDVGNTAGHGEISAGAVTATSKTVSGLPCDGRTLYVRLWTHIGAAWQAPADYTLKSCTATRASMATPVPGSRFTGSTVTFTWTAFGAADAYWLDVGNAAGQGDISAGQTAATSRTVSGIPTDGRVIYVRLWTRVSGVWQIPADYTYQAQ
jgi:hypothetical protein